MGRYFFIFVLSGFFYCAAAQNTDSLQTIEEDTFIDHSPKKAMMLSAILPGAGQVYNKKAWKLPIIYAGFGTLGYFIYLNNHDYRKFRNAYTLATDGDPSNDMPEYRFVSAEALKQRRDQVRKWRDLTYILTGAFYALNIIDASVDAHLYSFRYQDFNVNMRPGIQFPIMGSISPGINFTVSF